MAGSEPGLWAEGIENMGSRTSILRMGEILRYEEQFGIAEYPVAVEKTGCAHTVQSLLFILPSLNAGGAVARRVLIR